MATRLEASSVEVVRNGGCEVEAPGASRVRKPSRGRGSHAVGSTQAVIPFGGGPMARLGGRDREEGRAKRVVSVPGCTGYDGSERVVTTGVAR